MLFMTRRNVVGDNIRKLRTKAGFTQEDLALKSGLSQGYINQLESGKRRFTQKSLESIARGLAVPLEALFKGSKAAMGPSASTSTPNARKKRLDKKAFLDLLNSLPDQIVEHYLILLRMEKKIWEKRKTA
jgi:transcriptional regulator with XRE-family HTH domain